MRRTMILVLAMMCSVLAAMAQDVMVLRMKDGTTRRFANGVKATTTVRFFEYAFQESILSRFDTEHDNGYSCQWDVAQVWHHDGGYGVAVIWEDALPQNFGNPRYGLCFGIQPGLTVEQCNLVEYFRNERSNVPQLRYILIGQALPEIINLGWKDKNGEAHGLETPLSECSHINMPLLPGQTYYYRTFAEGHAEEGGQMKTVVFYGPEKRFRVPHVMADHGYYASVRGTDGAVASFSTHFPDSVTAPTWQEMETLWNIWRATDEGCKIDLTADITTEQFDDGMGYRLNRIPDEFYTWMTQRDVVIDAFDGLAAVSTLPDRNGNMVPTSVQDRIEGLDSIPGGKYMRFTPNISNTNTVVTYRSHEVVPGVRYKLVMNFAPETLPTATATDSLPTKVRLTARPVNGTAGTMLADRQVVPANQMSVYENDEFCTTHMGLDLEVSTRCTNTEIRTEVYNRIMRIAEMRLTPMKEEE